MRWIPKSPEPDALLEHKAASNDDWTATYDNLDKKPVRSALVYEQGFLCGYCGARVGAYPEDCHIEHLTPQSKDVDLRLEWPNMLASCQGHDERARVPEHCGHARGDKHVPVTPRQPDCGSRFRFGSDGTIHPTGEDETRRREVADTIAALRLEAPRLIAARRAAISAETEDLEEAAEVTRERVAQLSVPDAKGRLSPFYFAVQGALDTGA